MTDGAIERLALVIAIAAVTYFTRWAGFRMRLGRADGDREDVAPRVERFLGYVPIAAFAALFAPGIADGSGVLSARLVAVLLTITVALWLRRLWLSIAAGFAGYWLVEALVASR